MKSITIDAIHITYDNDLISFNYRLGNDLYSKITRTVMWFIEDRVRTPIAFSLVTYLERDPSL